MKEILEAIKFKILYWLEIEVKVDPRQVEIEYLRMELSARNQAFNELVERLLPKNESVVIPTTNIDDEPIRGRRIPWDQRRRQLEAESRDRAAKLKREAEANVSIK